MLDIKLHLRDRLNKLMGAASELFDKLIGLSEQHKDVLLPGYTHLQVAMPSSFGLWFGAYAESLVDDLIQLNTAFEIINKNPLGSAAGYGSSLPLDRTLTTNLLGFSDLDYNSVYAQMNRGKTERIVANTYSQLAATISKLAMDITLYLSQNFGFISFPENITTGSSIMPHKKNPDVFELIRARCNRVMSLPAEINLITVNLPSGYHRDFQELKRNIIPTGIELTECVEVMNQMLKLIVVNRNIFEDEKYKFLFSVDAVNELVREGVSFREAYKMVGQQIESGQFEARQSAGHTHEGSIGNLCNDKIRQRKNKVMERYNYSEIDRALSKLVA
jgi:argininosuccinate lyase